MGEKKLSEIQDKSSFENFRKMKTHSMIFISIELTDVEAERIIYETARIV